jgi:hypothetical protein
MVGVDYLFALRRTNNPRNFRMSVVTLTETGEQGAWARVVRRVVFCRHVDGLGTAPGLTCDSNAPKSTTAKQLNNNQSDAGKSSTHAGVVESLYPPLPSTTSIPSATFSFDPSSAESEPTSISL